MAKYRIKEIECYGGDKVYEVQKRLLGFLWWYNFLNGDAWDDWETGIFSSQKMAEEAIECDMWKNKTRIVKTY